MYCDMAGENVIDTLATGCNELQFVPLEQLCYRALFLLQMFLQYIAANECTELHFFKMRTKMDSLG